MKERTIQFGKNAKLVGILTKADGDFGNDRPAVLLLNSGILHRVGSCRLHVKLARNLAESGFHVLRFDFSGMGDSSARRDSLPFEESSVVEVQEAMDYLAARGLAGRFVLGGLCSGADAAYFAAVVDDRVVGTVQLDAFAYRNFRYHWNHYAARVFRMDVWKRFMARILRLKPQPVESVELLSNPTGPSADDIDTPEYVREFPPKREVEKNMFFLNGRGVKQYYFFSGSMADTYNYANQFRDLYRSVRFGDSVTVRYLPAADHIVTKLDHQVLVTTEISDWMTRWWGEAASTHLHESAPSASSLATDPV